MSLRMRFEDGVGFVADYTGPAYDETEMVGYNVGSPMITERPDIGESAGLVNGVAYHKARSGAETVDWSTPGLRVTRFRLLSDPGLPWWDVSYCHGRLNGKDVDVELPFSQLPKRGWRAEVVRLAKKEGIYAKGLGILDNVSTLC